MTSDPGRDADAGPVAVASAALAGLSTGCVVLVITLVTADVFARNVAGTSIPGVLEITEVALVGIVYLGLALAQRRQEHVCLSLFVDRQGPRVQRAAHLVATLVSIAVTAWFCWASWDAALTAFERGEYRFGLVHVPIWPARFAISIGFTVLLLEFLVDLRRIVTGRALPSTDFSEETI